MRIRKVPFEAIRSGAKDIELRLLDEKRKSLAIGDEIIFTNIDEPDQKVRAQIENLHSFENFAQLYKKFDKTRLGYTANEIPDPKDMERYYSAEEQKMFGVVGIEIKLKEDASERGGVHI